MTRTVKLLSGDDLARVMAKNFADLTHEEWIALPPDEWRAKGDERRAAEDACPKHERQDLGTHDEHQRGWHRLRCKHCDADMSYDSGD